MHVQNLPGELFTLILKLLESRDLLQCATVCSRWKDLALDVKWKEHKVELVDMFRSLGSIEPSWFTTKHSSIKDAVASAGWRRLNELRKKVTRLRIRKQLALDDIKYVISLQHSIEAAHQPFCPKLRRLDVKIVPRSQPYAYDFLAGQSLIKIRIRWTPRDHGPLMVMIDAVERAALQSPMVEHIEVSLSDSHFIDYGKFSRIRTLIHEGDFSMESLSQLCKGCPLLEVARLWWMQAALVDDETIYSEPREIQVFPALQGLNIADAAYGAPSLRILRSTKMPQLRELEADLGEEGFSETHMLFEHIRRESPFLETLTVTAGRLE
ncbi:hypothetical protein FS837_010961 [Tulasnella sp. UAMH 9824]|nr:hypothetical protein FS837_010961 [Tulasnella sp. UAMH 9824]